MSLAQAAKKLAFDKRLIERNLQTGVITQEELKKHLESLPDLAAKIEMVSFEEQRNRREDIH